MAIVCPGTCRGRSGFGFIIPIDGKSTENGKVETSNWAAKYFYRSTFVDEVSMMKLFKLSNRWYLNFKKSIG